MMKFILPLPPSDNERLIVMWKYKRFILSNKYRNYKKEAQMEIMRQIDFSELSMPIYSPTFENQLPIYISFYLKDKRRDATDMLKCLLDTLGGLLYNSDKWVVPKFIHPYRIDKLNPRLEICL